MAEQSQVAQAGSGDPGRCQKGHCTCPVLYSSTSCCTEPRTKKTRLEPERQNTERSGARRTASLRFCSSRFGCDATFNDASCEGDDSSTRSWYCTYHSSGSLQNQNSFIWPLCFLPSRPERTCRLTERASLLLPHLILSLETI